MTVILAAIVAVSLSPLAKWLHEKTTLYRRRRAWRRRKREDLRRLQSPLFIAQWRQNAEQEAEQVAERERLWRQIDDPDKYKYEDE